MPKKISGSRFAVCTNNEGYPSSLEPGKIYRILPDSEAAFEGDLRVIDESGEDYIYSADRFYFIETPAPLEQVLLRIYDTNCVE